MRQTAAAVNGKGNMPYELWLALTCERWGALPSEILAQPAGLLDKMALVKNVADAYESLKRVPAGQGAAWYKRNEKAFKLIQEIEGWQQSD